MPAVWVDAPAGKGLLPAPACFSRGDLRWKYDNINLHTTWSTPRNALSVRIPQFLPHLTQTHTNLTVPYLIIWKWRQRFENSFFSGGMSCRVSSQHSENLCKVAHLLLMYLFTCTPLRKKRQLVKTPITSIVNKCCKSSCSNRIYAHLNTSLSIIIHKENNVDFCWQADKQEKNIFHI